MLPPRARFIAFRRSLPRAPRLERRVVHARGLHFAVWATPPVVDATPLCCINGGLLFDHKLLWPALSPLAAKRQLFFYDQRGRGESEAPPGAHAARIDHDAGDVPALRVALGLRRWDLLGHSWGGGIAALAAERDRDAVRRLVLVDAVGPQGDWLHELHDAALARLGPTERAVLGQLDPAALTTPVVAVHSAYSRAFYPAWFVDAELAGMFTPPRSTSVTGAAVAARLRSESYDWRPLLRAVSADSLVIHGAGDLLPARVAHELVAAIPKARLVLIPDAGHMPFWEAPEAFFAAVEHFLASPTP